MVNSQPLPVDSFRKVFTASYLLRAALFFAVSYAVFWVVSHVAWFLLIDTFGIEIKTLDPGCRPAFIIVFVLFFLPVLYFVSSLIAQKAVYINFQKLILYMGCTFFGAMWCEVFLDTLFVKFTGQPAWLYKVWPFHYGYTSGVGMFMWPLYGFFIYCQNIAIETNPRLAGINNNVAKAFLYALDAMALEILTNIFAIMLFHTYLFYYLWGDLHHFTTIQIFIPYFILCGLGAALSMLLELIKKNHLVIGLAFYFAGVVCLLYIV